MSEANPHRLDPATSQEVIVTLMRAGRADRPGRVQLTAAAAARLADGLGEAPFYPAPVPGAVDAGSPRPTAGAVAGSGPLETSLALVLWAIGAGGPDARTLFRSVLRPLAERLGQTTTDDEAVAARVTTAAAQATDALAPLGAELSAALTHDPHPATIEAAAGLARLGVAARMTAAPASLRVARDGPYCLTGTADVTDHLGRPLEAPGAVAFCRCGRSAAKPFCDGSHVEGPFSGDKDARRVPDKRDAYEGQQAVVYDNRGLCAHSGFCTDRLASVFHLGEEPFVTPSGARFDDIVRAVRRCPSGALSVGLGEREDRELVDQPRPLAIEISKDGPYRVCGTIALLDEAGAPIPRNAGASLEHYSLCRCGASQNKPFCSGMHWSTGFADPRPDPAHEPTLFEWAGGYPALLDMTRLFYSRHVPADPLIGPLFATMAPDHPERVASWLSEVFGGPSFYSDRYGGYARMISQHLDKHLTPDQRAHWARLMAQCADEVGLPSDAEFRAAFTAYIEWGSRIALENSQTDAKPPPNMPVPRWWWVCNATPSARVSALAPAEEAAPPGPAAPEAGEPVSFERHVKPLFRQRDRGSMRFAFDLWSHDDVSAHAEAIHARLHAGTMPCDGAWPAENVALFARWIEEGKTV